MPAITPLYFPPFVLLFVVLAARAIILRRRYGIGVGTGDQPVLHKALRAHGNFAEYVPLALIAIYFLELRGVPAWWIHLLCSTLLVGRVVHAIGVSRVKEDYRLRVFGMGVTFTILCASALRITLSAFVAV